MATNARLQIDEIQALVNRHNEVATRVRRDYCDYLLARAPQNETIEEHLDSYGLLARTGEHASPEQILKLETVAGSRCRPSCASRIRRWAGCGWATQRAWRSSCSRFPSFYVGSNSRHGGRGFARSVSPT